MSTYHSDFTLEDITDPEGATLDVADSYVEHDVRIVVFGANGAEGWIYLTPAQARRVAASLVARADKYQAGR